MRTYVIAMGAALVPTVLAAQPVFAAGFVFHSDNIGGNNRVGVHESITTFFNPESQYLTWSSTFSTNPKNGKLPNGAWLVLSDGPNPKYNEQQYTMFYLDGANLNSDGKGRLTAYTYNGVNGSDSWQDNNSVFLGSWLLDVEDNTAEGERTFSFGLNMEQINSRTDLGPLWEGTQFTDEVGIWYHGVADLDAAYNSDGELTRFDYSSQGWFDAKDLETKPVPEPATALGVGAVAAALGFVRRKQAAK
ncbi:MAG: PEP-CTERM sorting domain-containing protein [Cyanobacteria bacterium P01_C01_bin.73]